MLRRALKMAFWVTYDHLGKLILASIVWTLIVCPPGVAAMAGVEVGKLAFPRLLHMAFENERAAHALKTILSIPLDMYLFLGILAALLYTSVALAIASAGLAYMAKGLIDNKDGALGDMFRGIRLYRGKAAGLGLAYLFAACCFGASTWFYANKLRDSAPWLGYLLSGLALWALLFLLLTALFAAPALVQKKSGILGALKLAALLVLDNPLFSIGLGIQLLAITAVAFIVTPLFFFLYGGVAVVLASCAYEMLARKYALIAEAEEKGLERKPRTPLFTPEDDEEDDYLNRGMRDFLFPWKG